MKPVYDKAISAIPFFNNIPDTIDKLIEAYMNYVSMLAAWKVAGVKFVGDPYGMGDTLQFTTDNPEFAKNNEFQEIDYSAYEEDSSE